MMLLHDLAANLGERLTEADRRLTDALLAHPRETVFLSANEIAGRAGVNPATAVRYARKLGFDGYPALRARLQQDLFGASEAAERMRQRIRRLGRGSVLKVFIENEIGNLSRLPEQVSDAQLRAAARAVMRAQQTFLF
ncbi:MAG: MurR/RpiR family transcriptional regulator, partial [Burkholderiales bacterium]|nr:MurR/RpiR family transcriptional regulator [Burkholderiales bacterium]